MAVKTYYLGAGQDGNFAALSETAQAAASRADGWTVGKIANAFTSEYDVGVKQATTTFSANATTPKPASFLTGATANAFKIPAPLTGVFAATAWTFTFAVRAIVLSAQTGAMRLRVFKSANADGSAATELTAATQAGTVTATLSTTADVTTVVTWSPGATITLNNEYLFFVIAWNIAQASGSNTSDVVLRTGSTGPAGTRIVTPDFTVPVTTPVQLDATSALTPTLGKRLTDAISVPASATLTPALNVGRKYPLTLSGLLPVTPAMTNALVPKFPTATVVDDFNRADQVPPGSSWQIWRYPETVLLDSNSVYLRFCEISGGVFDWSGKTPAVFFAVSGSPLYRQSAVNPNGAGYSMSFPTGNDFISVTGLTRLENITDTFAIDFWIQRLSTTDTTNQWVCSKGSVAVRLNSSGFIEFLVPPSTIMVTSTVAITDLNAHHVAVVKSGATINLYLDGVAVTGTVTNQTITWGNSQPFYVGNDGTGSGNGCNFRIQDFTVTNVSYLLSHARGRWRGSGYDRQVFSLSSPSGYWGLGDTSGTVARHFTSVGGVPVNGTYMGSYTLNQPGAIVGDRDGSVLLGAGGYIEIPANANYNAGSSYFISAWVYPTASVADDVMIFGHQNPAGTGGQPAVLAMGPKGGSGLRVWAGFFDATVWKTIADTTDLPLNTWTHLGYGYNSSGTVLTLYRNGVSVATASLTGKTGISATIVYIGRHWSNTTTFPGRIDEVAYYGVNQGVAAPAGYFGVGRAGLQIVGNKLTTLVKTNYNPAAYGEKIFWITGNPGVDQEAFFTISAETYSGGSLYIALRRTPYSDDFYYVLLQFQVAGNETITVFKRVAGTTTQVGTADNTRNIVVGDIFGVKIQGNTITVYYKTGGSWVLALTRTDSSITQAGYVALTTLDGQVQLDDFGYFAPQTVPLQLSAVLSAIPGISKVPVLNRALNGSLVLTPAITVKPGVSRTFSAVISFTIAMSRLLQAPRALSVTSPVAPALVKKLAALRAFSVTTPVTPSMLAQRPPVQRALAAVTTLIPAISDIVKRFRSVDAATTLASVMSRRVFGARTFAVATTLIPTLVKKLSASRTAAVTTPLTPTLTVVKPPFLRNFNVSMFFAGQDFSYSDNFNRIPLTTDWTTFVSVALGAAPTIASNEMVGRYAGATYALSPMLSSNFRVRGTYRYANKAIGNPWIGIMNTNNEGYFADIENGTIYLDKHPADGNWINVGLGFNFPGYVSGGEWAFDVAPGGVMTIFYRDTPGSGNWQTVGTRTDTSFLGPYRAFYGFNEGTSGSSRLDDFVLESTVSGMMTRTPKFLRSVAGTITLTPNLTRLLQAPRAIAISVSLVPAVVKRITKPVAVISSIVPTLTRGGQLFLRSISATTTFTVTLVRSNPFLRAISATTTLTPALARKLSAVRTAAATTTLTPNLSKQLFAVRTFAVTSVITPAMTRFAFRARLLAVATTLTPTLSRFFKALRTVVGNLPFSPSMQKIASGEFTPSAISGLAIWFDASQLGLLDGAAVDAWPNLANAALPGVISGTPSPTVRTNARSLKPVVTFKVNEGRVRITGTGITTDWTLVYVAHMVDATPGRVVTGIYTPNNILVGWWNGYRDVMYDAGFTLPDFRTAQLTDWKMYSGDGVPGTSRFFIDGVSSGSTATAAGWGGTFAINGYDPTLATESCNCEVAEICFYNRALTTTERQQVESYLRTKWMGVQPVQTPKQLDVITTFTPVAVRVQKLVRAMDVTPTLTPVLARVLKFQRTVLATVTLTPALARKLASLRTLAVTSVITPSLSRLAKGYRAVAASVNLLPALSRRLSAYRTFGASTTLTPTLTPRVAAGRLLAASTAILAGLVKNASKPRSLAASVTLTPLITYLSGKGKVLNATASLVVGMKRTIGKAVAFSLNFIPKIQRKSTMKLAAPLSLNPALQASSRVGRIFGMVTTLSASLSLRVRKGISLAAPVPIAANMLVGRVNKITLSAVTNFTALFDYLFGRAQTPTDTLLSSDVAPAQLLAVENPDEFEVSRR